MEPVDRVKAINEAKIRAIHEERDLLNSIKPGDVRTAEQTEKLEKIQAAVADYEAQVKDIVSNHQRETETAQLMENSARLFGESRSEKRAARTQDVINAWMQQPSNSRGDLMVNIAAVQQERELLRQGASPEEIRNALAWDTGSIASAVPTTMARSLYEYMEASIAAFRIGATLIQTSSGENMDFPKLAAHAIATQVAGQGTALAGTDPTFAKLTLGAKKYGELVVVANEVLTDTVFDVGSFLGRDMGRAVGRKADTDLVLGTGGIADGIIDSSLGTVAAGGTTVAQVTTNAANPWIDTVYGIVDEYRNNGAKWLMRDATAGILRKLRDGGAGTIGAYLWEPSLTNGLVGGQPDRFLGYPVYTDPNVASLASDAAIAAFGDFSTYYLRTVGNVAIDSSTERYFDTDQTGFRAKWRLDGGYVDTNGVVVVRARVA